MADKIKLLPEVVANQIAAGEVVNRPSSVVKELMENAIDAGATSVKVNFRDGGKELIQVIDDGCGMSPIDARMAFDRHATSKIREVEDIYRLSTFGFRGEALPSIAAVAQVELRSRQEGDELGTQTEINGGEFAGQNPVMCPVGSQFFVRNLFYNVPARRRFLDKSTTSATQIKSEFRRVALCYPKIAFELYANDAPVYSLMPGGLAGRIVDLVGKHIKPNLLDVSADTSIASITGFIGRPSSAKKRNAEQYLFVNGRFFKSNYIVSAILKAYEKLIPTGTQPSFFLYLTIDTARIDVNVHPQKTEVKFSDEEAVWQIVNAAVRETLGKTGAVPMMDFDHEEAVDIPVLDERSVYTMPRAMSNSSYNPFLQEFSGEGNFEPTEDFTGFDLPEGEGRSPKRGEEFTEFVSGGTDGDDMEFESESDFGIPAPTATPAPRAPRPAAPRTGLGGFGSFGGGFSAPAAGGEDFEEIPSGADMPALRTDEFEDFVSAAGPDGTADGVSHLDFIASDDGSGQSSLDLDPEPRHGRPMALKGGLLLLQSEGRLLAVDVQRARERIRYDRCLAMLDHGSAVSEQLLFPERLELSTEEYALLEERQVEFAALGFDIDFAGNGTVDIKGIPADIPSEGIDTLLFELLQAFSAPVDLETLRREKIAAVMARQGLRHNPRPLLPEEADDLLARLFQSSDYSFSPSGKMILTEITTDEIRAKLG